MSDAGVGRASLFIASGTIVSRVLGLVRAMILAYAIGVSLSPGADAFAVASRIPNTIYTLVATGVLSAVLVPQITKAALARDGGRGYINKLVTIAIVGSGAMMLVAVAIAPVLVKLLGATWPADQLQLATMFAYWLLPQILFYTLYTVLGEVLNAKSLFGPYAWAPVLNNVLNIAGMLAFVALYGPDPDGHRAVDAWSTGGMALLAGSATLGVAAQALVLFLFWKRAGLSFRPDFAWRGMGLAQTGRIASWTFASVIVTQVVGFVNGSVMNIASGTGAALAASDMAGWIFVLPHSIITISLVTAYFTRMSENVHRNRMDLFKQDLSSSARLAGFAMMFFSVTLVVLAFPISRLMQPSASDVGVSSLAIVLIANLIGLVPFSLLFVFNRGFFAMSDTKTPFLITAGQSALTLLASAYCATLPPEMITATLSGFVSLLLGAQAVTTVLVLRRRIGVLGGRALTRSLVQSLLGALLSAAGGFGTLLLLGGIGAGSFVVAGFGQAFVSCALIFIIMAGIYAGAMFALGNREMLGLWNRVGAPLARKFRR